jgi:hypothetical protein
MANAVSNTLTPKSITPLLPLISGCDSSVHRNGTIWVTCFQPIPLNTSFPIIEPVSTLAWAFRRFSAVSGP